MRVYEKALVRDTGCTTINCTTTYTATTRGLFLRGWRLLVVGFLLFVCFIHCVVLPRLNRGVYLVIKVYFSRKKEWNGEPRAPARRPGPI